MENVIWKDTNRIRSEKYLYLRTVKSIQNIVDNLIALGLDIDSDIVSDLSNGGDGLNQQVKTLMEKETAQYKIKSIRDEHEKAYASTFKAITKAVNDLRPLKYAADALNTYDIDMTYFLCKDNTIELSDELDKYIEQKHTVHPDDIITEAQNRAKKLLSDIESFEKFLKENDSPLKPIGGLSFFGAALGRFDIISAGQVRDGYCVQLNEEAFRYFYNERRNR